MDDILMNAGLSTTGVAIVLIAYRFLKSIQGKKLVSNCCGRKLEVGMNVEAMTPNLRIDNPLHRTETLGVPITPKEIAVGQEVPPMLRG